MPKNPKQNRTRQTRNLIYDLKRREGFAIQVIKTSNADVDACSGVLDIDIEIAYVRYCIMIDGTLEKTFVYDLSYIAANRNFTTGGYFAKDTQFFYIDRKDLRNMGLTEDDMDTSTYVRVMKNDHVYKCKKLHNYEDDTAYIIEAVRTKEFNLDNLIAASPSASPSVSPSASVSPSPSPTSNFTMSVNTTKAGSAVDTFILPCAGGGYDAQVFWGDGNDEPLLGSPGNVPHIYDVPGIYPVTVVHNTPSGFPRIFFDNVGDNSKVLDVPNWGSTQWTNMQAAFRGCDNLTIITATDSPDLSSCTNMTSMFNGCTSMLFADVSAWDVSNITLFGSMFNDCFTLITVDVSLWDMSSATDMSSMFQDCALLAIIDVSSWTPDLVTTTASMFRNCDGITSINLSSWTSDLNLNMSQMFSGCALLETIMAATLDTSSVTTMASLFLDCTVLTSITMPGADTANVTDMSNMFRGCTILDGDISAFNVTSLVTADGMMNGSAFSQTNYDLLLVAWEAQAVLNNVPFHAGSAEFGAGAPATAKADLIADHIWSITDGGPA